MEQTGIRLQWPDSLFFAFPTIIVLLVLPAVLIYVVFGRMNYNHWVKIVLIPACLIGPLAATLSWPLVIKLSGLVGATGGDGTVTYTVIATGLLGDYSEYVWGGITTALVILLYKLSGRKNSHVQNLDI